MFQSDIFPPAPSAEPALTAGEFFSGKTARPKLVDLDTGAVSSAPPTAGSSPFAADDSPALSALQQVAPKSPSVPSATRTPDVKAAATGAATLKSENYGHDARTTPRSPAPVLPDEELAQENARLLNELRDARAQIRNLELLVETMKTNASKAAKLLESSVPL